MLSETLPALAVGLLIGAGVVWWPSSRSAARRRQRTELLTAALGTISGACYHFYQGQALRLDIKPADSQWPGDLLEIVAGLAEPDRQSLEHAIAAFRGEGRSFFLRADCRLAPDPAAEAAVDGARTLEISAHRLVPETVHDRPHLGWIDLIWVSDVSERVRSAEASASAAKRGALVQLVLEQLPFEVWWRHPDLTLAGGNRAPEALAPLVSAASDLARAALAEGAPQESRAAPAIDGTPRPLVLAERPLPEGGTVGFALDRREAESISAELGRLVLGHREVLESVSTAIAIYGPDTRLMFHNSAFIALWGIDAAAIQYEPSLAQVLELLHEERVLPESADFRRFKAEETALFETLRSPREDLMHLPDGRTIRLKVARHPFGGLTFIYDDVTDRIALERSYNTLMEVQRETLDNLFEGIAVFGSDGRLKLWNPTFVRNWRADPEDFIARPHVTTLVESGRDLLSRDHEDWETTKREIVGLVTDARSFSGRLERRDDRTMELNVVALPDGNVLWSFLDVTDSTRVQRALLERNEALEASSRLKSEFIANVSYELRTPLNAIIGFAEILANQYFGTLNERQGEYAAGILEGSHRLLALIDDILDLATIEAGHMTLERVPVDIHTMLAAVLTLARERAGRLELNLALDCPIDIGTVQLDQRRIRQALFNLVSNAIKFTPSGGSIVLSARRLPGEILLGVADNGIGIAPEDQPRVFDKFERGDRRARQVGAGLGLALVKSFAELHGGRVELTSEPGFGTNVMLRLPIQSPTLTVAVPGGGLSTASAPGEADAGLRRKISL